MTTLNKASQFLLLIALLTACASNESFDTAKEINEECYLEMQAAHTAVRLRDKGNPQAILQDSLPPITPKSSRLLRNLHDIVTEIFQYKTLNEVIYPTYRFELCSRQLQNKPYPASLAMLEKPLLNCQQQYGMDSSKQSTECVIQIIDNLNPIQLIDPAQQRAPPL